MKITQQILEEIGLKCAKYDDIIDSCIRHLECLIKTKSNLAVLIEIQKQKEGDKWVEKSVNICLTNGTSLYKMEGVSDMNELHDLLKMMGGGGVDLALLKKKLE